MYQERSIENSVEALMQWLEDYIEKPEGEPIIAIRNDKNGKKNNSMGTLND